MKKLLLFASLSMIVILGPVALFVGKHAQKQQSYSSYDSQNLKKRFQSKTKKPLKNKKEVMMGHADKFAKIHQDIRTRSTETKPSYQSNYRFNEVEKAKVQLQTKRSNKSKVLQNLEVTQRGPANVGGRTRAIVVDPTDETKNTWFAGAVGGGIWKTTNKGESWENLTPKIPNLSISAMKMAPSNPDVIYAGTGEGFFNLDAIRGDGLIASFDHGTTWKQVTGTVNFGCVNRIIIDPDNEKIIEAAVSGNRNDGVFFGRIHKTMDGGNTWETIYEDENGNRVQDLRYHPTDFNTQYASINSVGIIKTTDAGSTWEQVLDLSNYSRSELAIAPSNANVIYAAVEGNNQSLLFKTSDAGQNWENIGDGTLENWLGAQGWYDNAIGINPYDENDVYLGGIRLWKLTKTYGGIVDIQENGTEDFMQFVPWGGFQNSGIGTGAQFSSTVGLPGPINLNDEDYSSIEIRFGPNTSQKAHAFAFDGQQTSYSDYVDVPFEVWDTDNNRQLMATFVDLDNNGAFDLIPVNPDITEIIWINAIDYNETTPSSSIMGNNGLGFLYKNIYVIMPALAEGADWDPENLPESNLAIIYNTSGEGFPAVEMISGNNTVHVDHHNLTMIPMNDETESFRIINGSDGGVYYSDDKGNSFTDCLNGYNTTQFYGADKKPGADSYIGGMQDNGTWQSISSATDSTTNYRYCIGGDGYETSWHYTNPNLVIGGSQFNGLRRSTDGGSSWDYVGGQIDNGRGNAPFVTKIGKSNSDPDVIFAVGVSGIWRSENFGANWSLISIPAEKWEMNSLTQIEISYANPKVVWGGSYLKDIDRPDATLHVSTDGGVTFNAISGTPDYPMGRLTGLATHPTHVNTAYALFSFANAPKILRTTDLGETWEDISGFGTSDESTNGFPDVATYSLVVMPHNPNIIWAGTEIGLFESTDAGETWHYAIDEFPAVSIWQMTITNDQIVMATHGRGIMTVTIPELPENPPVVTLSPSLQPNGISLFEDIIKFKATLRSAYDSTQLIVNNEYYLTIQGNTEPKNEYIEYIISEKDVVDFQLKAYKEGEIYPSGILTQSVAPLNDIAITYTTDFDDNKDDFIGSGFSIYEAEGFNSKAIHSLHPYQDGKIETFLLMTPIEVKEENAIIEFNEIAIIEPGEPGSSYPSSAFYDYVVVEGSKNGVSWTALDKGYDATAHEDWLAAYNSGSAIDESLYKKRTINMQDKFNTGDVILIRFKIYADGGVNSWGWAIDSLEIQNSSIGIENNTINNSGYAISQNYPNPFNEFTTINYTIPTNEMVTIQVFNIEGRLVETLTNKNHTAGDYQVEWQAKNSKAGTYYYRIQAGEFIKTKKLLLIK